ncbi:hypothetical protein ACIBCH_20160 [Amycolatopsis thailandensis]|uniref:hypothetical protein n=1 Tax=Amycolatopsis thailandensis TaxID=589330 RepID=UPI00379D5BB4
MLGRTGILDGANRPYRDLVRPDQLGTLVERAGDADLLRDWISLDWPVWHYFGDVQAKLTASFPRPRWSDENGSAPEHSEKRLR